MAGNEETGERIAKAISRAGLMSRRDAEKAILAGRVAVNGKTIASPALDIAASDKVTVDGRPIDAPQEVRLWLYYKPLGLIVSEKDEKGRQTVFDTLPEGMPRVMSVGRLDLNSEGLLLLTNDGGLKRRLEMPATGWLRKYRVRVMGRPTEAMLAPLRAGVTIDGEDFQPMEISIDRQQGANAWLTIGIREGKNREVRRAMAEVGLNVNRLIRISYGPFRLTGMKPGEISELRRKVLREQLGGLLTGEEAEARPRKRKPGTAGPDRPRKPRAATGAGDRPERKPRTGAGGGDRPARSFAGKPGADRPERKPRAGAAGGDRPARGFAGKPGADRPERKPRAGAGGGDRPARSFAGKPGADRPERKPRAPSTSKTGGPRGGGPGRGGPGKPGGPRPGGPRGAGGPRRPGGKGPRQPG